MSGTEHAGEASPPETPSPPSRSGRATKWVVVTVVVVAVVILGTGIYLGTSVDSPAGDETAATTTGTVRPRGPRASAPREAGPPASEPGAAATQPPSTTSSTGGEPDVDWQNYSPMIRRSIDQLAAAGDCAGLQEASEIASKNDANQLNRTGDGNADLVAYIDFKLQASGC